MRETKTKWFLFDQTNSGGYFVREDKHSGQMFGERVWIEAGSAEEANARATTYEVGLYFNGIDKDIDCSCCGDRWWPVSERYGREVDFRTLVEEQKEHAKRRFFLDPDEDAVTPFATFHHHESGFYRGNVTVIDYNGDGYRLTPLQLAGESLSEMWQSAVKEMEERTRHKKMLKDEKGRWNARANIIGTNLEYALENALENDLGDLRNLRANWTVEDKKQLSELLLLAATTVANQYFK